MPEIQATPVAIAAIAVAGIVAIAYSPLEGDTRILAIATLGQLAGAAGGVAIPRGGSGAIATSRPWGDAPASNPPEWTDR